MKVKIEIEYGEKTFNGPSGSDGVVRSLLRLVREINFYPEIRHGTVFDLFDDDKRKIGHCEVLDICEVSDGCEG